MQQRVDELNDVIYDRTENGGTLALFDRIFGEIKRVEQAAIVEDQKLVSKQREFETIVDQLQY